MCSSWLPKDFTIALIIITWDFFAKFCKPLAERLE